MIRLLAPQRVVRGYRDGSIRQLRLLVVLPKWMRFQKDGAIEMHCEGSIYIDQDPHALIDDGYLKPPVLPGQEFWMAEKWCEYCYVDERGYTHFDQTTVYYAADDYPDFEIVDGDGFLLDDQRIKWHSSTSMPRKYARTFGKALTVRVQRVQEMTEEDCYAEGVPRGAYAYPPSTPLGLAKGMFRIDWDAEHPRNPWAWNPWTWVIEPERSKP